MSLGQGAPLDKYDEACNKLARCNRCAAHDSVLLECDPQTTPFNAQLTWDSDSFGLAADCSSTNDNDCAEHLCSCEIDFINSVLTLLWSFEPRDLSLKHDDEDWDSSICTPAAKRCQSGDALFCCGTYPKRYTYGSCMGCCESDTSSIAFNPLNEVCCDNGDVVGFGSSQCSG